MGPSDININVLQKTIEKMIAEFYTKDVSNHPDMISAHQDLIHHSHYHSFVGKAIKRLSNGKLNGELKEVRSGTTKGSMWRKVTSGRIEVTDIKNNRTNVPITEKPTLINKKWFKIVLIIVLVIVAILDAIAWIYIIIFFVVLLFIGSILKDVLKESNRDK